MIGKLYKAKHGTNHIVRVNNMVREMLKGESLNNTARTYQVIAQRQKIWDILKDGTPCIDDDRNFTPFTMEYELFLEEYEEINE